MKLRLTVCGIILLAILAAALYLRFGGVTHGRIYARVSDVYGRVIDESGEIQEKIDDRYRALDQKLDRIEGKLDRILEIANRPLPDNIKPAR